jgi:phosphoribosylaminoimidazolecarboxamide formyltransferase/IMP cyclohydrolase
MRALLSVYDKTGVVELATALHELGWQLLSSRSTAQALAEAGLPVTDVADVTGVPPILGHRVVTLHPRIHGGLLADREEPSHIEDMAEYGIQPIDLVVSNLYPFSSDPSIELIDIGGPAMVRAAAKNHRYVGVVTDPAQYGPLVEELRANGSLSADTRRRLAGEAFAATAAYDAQIVEWLARSGELVLDEGEQPGASPATGATGTGLPERIDLTLTRRQGLRYGENPHQVGARYSVAGGAGWWDDAVQHGGKELSYLNVYDADAAWRLVHSLGEDPAAVVIKHANPCGVAVAGDITTAYRRAHECDPVSAYGGIVAVNRPVTAAMAEAIGPVFTEVLVAPGFEDGVLAGLQQRKKNLRILEARPPSFLGLSLRTIDGGYLVQTPDVVSVDRSHWQVPTKVAPTEAQWADVELAWRVVARVTSNAIVLVKDRTAFGIGCGQQNRRDSGRLACEKADGRAAGGVYASDAFFPFPDGLDGAIEAGAALVVQPGGSIRDELVIARADEVGLAMVFTGERHFRH